MSPLCTTGLACLQAGIPLDLKLPPYNRFNNLLKLASHAPIFAPDADELGPKFINNEEESLYLLNHWAIDLLLPFVRKPSRTGRVDPGYLAWLLDKAQIALSAHGEYTSKLLSSRLAQSLVDELVRLIRGIPADIANSSKATDPQLGNVFSRWMRVVPLNQTSEYQKTELLPFAFQLPRFKQN
ncbi:hypothetical protein B0H17DRAFT_1220881 [Mycena rosella]|uniref:Uncharacterized protein n=1 Tax=Mycena rosella TaxID=1033263 RepID=A0AAD7B7B3_MYCRO|nr:hypothetical protein B0H17DRAFT_1220881 [Mycena rosella]